MSSASATKIETCYKSAECMSLKGIKRALILRIEWYNLWGEGDTKESLSGRQWHISES